ncbi:MAG: hypothetical protein QOI13_1139 [Paraburkholderia sp.]|jgi:hypothetical protein|nr:hypothetical protein [Paraburkholderia sp.]
MPGANDTDEFRARAAEELLRHPRERLKEKPIVSYRPYLARLQLCFLRVVFHRMYGLWKSPLSIILAKEGDAYMSDPTSFKACNGLYWRVDPNTMQVSANGTSTGDVYCQFTFDNSNSSIFSVGAKCYVGPGSGGESEYLYATYESAYSIGYPKGSIDNALNWIMIQFQTPQSTWIVCDENSIQIEEAVNYDERTQFECDPPFPSS